MTACYEAGVFKKVLIANRGECAVRIARGCRELGVSPIAVYSEVDRSSLHVRVSDEAYAIGPAASAESYLRIDRILAAARRSGADAIHPGYGFLSENAEFAQAVMDAGLTWIGPPPAAMAAMGDKIRARALAVEAGVPVVPGTEGPVASEQEAAKAAQGFGYPVLIKAAAGGGGKGMRVVHKASELAGALHAARSEAKSSFGNDSVYMEKYLQDPRHIEIQVLCDGHGAYLHLFDRECSIQRRHQKVVEECPSPAIDDTTRFEMAEVALALARKIDYVGVGTVEFLYDPDGKFYFLEMNTRLQVEHPVTEAVTGIDLVKAMLRIADGQALPFGQDAITRRGHAIECRIYAEDPDMNFMPSPGLIDVYRFPGGPGVRVDGGVYAGFEVPTAYDPMIAKLITFGLTREAAVRRMRRALREYTIGGIKTTIPLFLKIMHDADFNDGKFSTRYLEHKFKEPTRGDATPALLAAALAAYERDRDSRVIPQSQRPIGVSTAWRTANWRWYNHRRGFGRS